MAINTSFIVKHTFVEVVDETKFQQLRARFATDSLVNLKRKDSFDIVSTDCDSNEDVSSEPESLSWADIVDEDDDTRSTVMLRGLKETVDRDALVSILQRKFRNSFDFVYVPCDFNTLRPQGFAFVDFVDHKTACQFQQDLPHELGTNVHVLWSDKEQGLDENIARYRNSPVMHSSLPELAKPILMREGVVVSFPKPTKAIKAPKVKRAAM
jgi:hypothetical protein